MEEQVAFLHTKIKDKEKCTDSKSSSVIPLNETINIGQYVALIINQMYDLFY